MTADLIRVLLVDSYGIVREGVRCLLAQEPDLTVTGEAADSAQALRLLARFRQRDMLRGLPDVVVTERDLPDMAAAKFVRQVKAICPTVRILILTQHDDETSFRTLLEQGADGYMLKQAATADLVAAIRALARGDTYLSPPGARRLLAVVRRSQRPPITPGLLSAREQEILDLLARGATIKEIATRLNISVNTVESHRARVLEKLQATNTVAAIVSARRAGLLSNLPIKGHQVGHHLGEITEQQPGDS
jgi:DNA-binding NarL/FixJ family response regulator